MKWRYKKESTVVIFCLIFHRANEPIFFLIFFHPKIANATTRFFTAAPYWFIAFYYIFIWNQAKRWSHLSELDSLHFIGLFWIIIGKSRKKTISVHFSACWKIKQKSVLRPIDFLNIGKQNSVHCMFGNQAKLGSAKSNQNRFIAFIPESIRVIFLHFESRDYMLLTFDFPGIVEIRDPSQKFQQQKKFCSWNLNWFLSKMQRFQKSNCCIQLKKRCIQRQFESFRDGWFCTGINT